MSIGIAPSFSGHMTVVKVRGYPTERIRFSITMMTDLQPHLTAVAPHYADHGRAIMVPGAMAFDIVGPPPGRIIRVSMFMALFSGILIHFIGFHDLIGQGRGGKDAAPATSESRAAFLTSATDRSPIRRPDARSAHLGRCRARSGPFGHRCSDYPATPYS